MKDNKSTIDPFEKYLVKDVIKNTIVISAFPGTGKTHYYSAKSTRGKYVLDSDSSKFDKSEFPQNYIDHIKSQNGKVNIIFVSSHKEVREALVANEIGFILVYPEIGLKDEYIERFKKRGSSEAFISLLLDKFEEWVTQLMNQKDCVHNVLKSGQYISDIITRKDFD